MLTPAVLAAALFGPPVCAQQDDPPSFSVHGTIVNSLTHQPIARAEVILSQRFAVLTDGEGRFEFDQIAPGQYSLSVQRPGYDGIGYPSGSGRAFAFSTPSQPREIRVGPNMPDLTFLLTPHGAIKGQVSLSTSEPAEDVRLTVYRRQMQSGHPRWQMAGTATTNSDGVFRFDNLTPADYLLYTQPSLDQPGLGTSGAMQWGYPSLYYPGVTDPSTAAILTVSAGQTVEADFALTRQAFYPVVAQVQAADAHRGIRIQILDRYGRTAEIPARYDRQHQTVIASLPNGAWTLEIETFGKTRLSGQREFQVAGAPVTLGIALLPAPRVPVTIHKEFTAVTGTANSPNSVAPYQKPAVNLQLESAETFGGQTAGSHIGTDDPSAETWTGSLEAKPGRYWVTVQGWPGYIGSITSGGLDLAANPLVIPSGGSPAPIEIVLRNDSGSISGQIAEPARNALAAGGAVGEIAQPRICAIPLFAASIPVAEGRARENGQFIISNLPPGTYRVVTCDSPQEIDSHTPEGLARWEGKGQVVSVAPGQTAQVQLEMAHVETQP